MSRYILLFFLLVPIFFSCSKEENDVADNTPVPTPDQRDKFLGSWEGWYYIQIPNLPPNSPLAALPDSVPSTITITKSSDNPAEILIAISNQLTGNRSVKAFVNGNRYYYDPFNANFGFINVSFKGDGLLTTDGKNINEEGFLKTAPNSFLNLASFVGVWSSKLKKKL